MTVPRKRAATIRDVASAAQVSTATVSKFVNGGQRFTAEVEARISRAVRELGYMLNPMARGMITGRTGNVFVAASTCSSGSRGRRGRSSSSRQQDARRRSAYRAS